MNWRSPLIPVVLLAAAGLMMIGGARNMTLTVDEAKYVGIGRRLAETGDWRLLSARLHPPLPYYLNSIWLRSADVPEEIWNSHHQDERGRALCRLLPGHRALLLFRLPGIALTLGLLLLVYVEARRAFGPKAGAAALALSAFEPNLLAHGSLATADLPLTATFLWAVLRARRVVEEGGVKNILLAGLAVGLALLSKYSAVVLVVILPAAAIAARPDRRLIYRAPLVLVLALIVLHAAYLPLYVKGGSAATPFYRGVFPRPFGHGVEHQRTQNEGFRSYFMGEIEEEGWLAYYPVAILVKTPIPLLLLAAAGLVVVARDRRRREAVWLLLAPALFLAFFMAVSRINIGVRYVLPLYPFFALLGGLAVSKAAGRRSGAVVLLLIVWQAAGAAATYPHFLSYFNEAAGGSEGGARILLDSNIDWGQDLPGLADWLERNGHDGCYLAYFGNGDPDRYGIRYRYLPGWLYSLPPEVYDKSLAYRPEPELVALSRMVYHGIWLPERDIYSWLEEYPRVATIGGSILVFDIGGDPDAHDRLAGVYKKAGRHELFRDELLIGEARRRESRGGGR